MRRFLTAFICLSTLVVAQNVIAAAPASSAARGAIGFETIDFVTASTSDPRADDGLVVSPVKPEHDNIPAPGTMMLLVAGLSGLAAVGSRTDEREAQGSPPRTSA